MSAHDRREPPRLRAFSPIKAEHLGIVGDITAARKSVRVMEALVDSFQQPNIVLCGERRHADRRRLIGFVRCSRGNFRLLGRLRLPEARGRSRCLTDLGGLGDFCGFGGGRRLECFGRSRLLRKLAKYPSTKVEGFSRRLCRSAIEIDAAPYINRLRGR